MGFWQLYNTLLKMCSLKCNRDILMLTLLYYYLLFIIKYTVLLNFYPFSFHITRTSIARPWNRWSQNNFLTNTKKSFNVNFCSCLFPKITESLLRASTAIFCESRREGEGGTRKIRLLWRRIISLGTYTWYCRILIYNEIMTVVLIAFPFTYFWSLGQTLTDIHKYILICILTNIYAWIQMCTNCLLFFYAKIGHLEDTSRLNIFTYS